MRQMKWSSKNSPGRELMEKLLFGEGKPTFIWKTERQLSNWECGEQGRMERQIKLEREEKLNLQKFVDCD